MLKVIVLASLISCLYAEVVQTEVSTECQWGPSYWCSSVKAAKECGAVHFCIRSTWRQSSFVANLHDDNTCTFCQKIITDIRDYVTADQTEKAIVAFADEACAEISDKFIADECKGIANMYIVQVIAMLRQKMDVKAVCRAVNLCATSDMFISPIRYRPHFAVSQEVLTRMAIDKLQTAKVDDAFQVLANATAKSGSPVSNSELRPFTGTSADQCATCKQGVEDLKIVFSSAQVRDEVTQILKSNICPRFVLPAECNKLLDDYAPEIYQAIVNLDPTAACETIGLCKVEKGSTLPSSVPLVQPSKIALVPLGQPTGVLSNVKCVVCEYVLSTIIQALQNNKTDQKVIETVEHICEIMPKTVEDECTKFIDQYGQELIDLLTHSTDPKSVCTVLNLCSAATFEPKAAQELPASDVDLSESVKPFMNIGPVLNGFEDSHESVGAENHPEMREDEKCMMCRIVVNYLISTLNENYTAQAVEAALDKVCNMLPDQVSSECRQFVDNYTPQLLAVFMSNLNTQTVCLDLHLCHPSSKDGNELADQLVLTPVVQ